MAAAVAQPAPEHFRVLEDGHSVEFVEQDGNSFSLAPVLRKYTAAKLQVKGSRRITVVELSLLADALGLLRSLQYDVVQFNTTNDGVARTPSQVRYLAYRLTRQGAAFGVRVPRPGTGAGTCTIYWRDWHSIVDFSPFRICSVVNMMCLSALTDLSMSPPMCLGMFSPVVVPGLDALVAWVESMVADSIAAARTMIVGGVVEFAGLAEFFQPGTDLLDRGAATGLYGVPTAMRVRAGTLGLLYLSDLVGSGYTYMFLFQHLIDHMFILFDLYH
jgi:hypothetical protein